MAQNPTITQLDAHQIAKRVFDEANDVIRVTGTGATGTITITGTGSNGDVPVLVENSLVPARYDEIDLTYVAAGNGAGEIQTVTYKLATVSIATLTLTYNASNKLTSVVKS